MQLHQLLRMVDPRTSILLFDIQGVSIGFYNSKEEIDINLYEESVLNIGILHNATTSYLTITLQK